MVGGPFGVGAGWAAEDSADVVGADGIAAGTHIGLARQCAPDEFRGHACRDHVFARNVSRHLER
ncbi:hypothetical protein [Nocardia sp. CA-119907]|uniref:hypothetical protein n=1 Tax=Nocardia sp. CA-119907 TaxID=3239973 RepID=UPI003D96A232